MKTDSDATVYRAGYAGAGTHNYLMEIRATDDGLEIDESVVVPWSWIFRALATIINDDTTAKEIK